jgi:thymidylate synthase ThyX
MMQSTVTNPPGAVLICELIAHSVITNRQAMAEAGYTFYADQLVTDPDDLAEFAGRVGSDSWARAQRGMATNRDYLNRVLQAAEISVLEHTSATFYVADVPVAVLEELQRPVEAKLRMQPLVLAATATQLMASGNLWTWRSVLDVWLDKDVAVKAVAKEMLYQLRRISPGVFQDLA